MEFYKSTLKKNILLFDGECPLCNGFVLFLLSHKREVLEPLFFSSLQGETAKQLFQPKVPTLEAVVLFQNGELFIGSTAFLKTLAFLGVPWRLLSFALFIPKVLREPLYLIIAKNRYFLFKNLVHRPIKKEHRGLFLP